MAFSRSLFASVPAHDHITSVLYYRDIIIMRVSERVRGHCFFEGHLLPDIRTMNIVLCEQPFPFSVQILLSILVLGLCGNDYSVLFYFAVPRFHFAARMWELDLYRKWLCLEQIAWTRARFKRLLQCVEINYGLPIEYVDEDNDGRYIVHADEVPFRIDWAHAYRLG